MTPFPSDALARQAILALGQAWLHADQAKTALPHSLLTRSVAILKALQKYTTSAAVKAVLLQTQQQIESELQNQTAPEPIKPPTAQQVPWFDPHFAFPASQADLGLGTQWKKELKAQRSDPQRRLQLALSKLPYRLAYQEAILALRAILRTTTNPKDHVQALSLLYWLAASASFLETENTTPPGDQIIAALKGETLQNLPILYPELGTKALSLLNQTDQKNLEQHFGRAKQHTTLKALQPALWSQYQASLQQLKPETLTQ